MNVLVVFHRPRKILKTLAGGDQVICIDQFLKNLG